MSKSRRARSLIGAFAAVLVAAPAVAQSSLVDGASLRSAHFELVKKLGTAARASLIRPDEILTKQMREAQDGEAAVGMQLLGRPLEPFLAALAGPTCPVPLLRGAILPYDYLRPMDESPARGRMYVMYVGELDWPFPAPLYADLIRVRVAWDTPHVVRDLLTVQLMRWGRDHIEVPPPAAAAMPRLRAAALLDDLRDPEVARSRWRLDQTVRELLRRQLTPPEVAALEEVARSASLPARLGALRVLGIGGWAREARSYEPLLHDPAPELQQAAFWALLALGDRAALSAAHDFPGRRQAIAARLRDSHAAVSDDELTFETAMLDWLVASALGMPGTRPAAPVPPPRPPPETPPPDDVAADAEPAPAR